MSTIENTTDLYDPEHPWISGPEEDPTKANWLSEFTNPAGETSKPVFLRGQSLLGIFRYLMLVASFTLASGTLTLFILPPFKIPGFDGLPLVGMILFLVTFILIAAASVVSHVRRLSHAGRSPFWALFITLPVVIALSGGLLMLAGMNMQVGLDPSKAKPKPVAEKTATPEAGKTDDAAVKQADKPKPAARSRGRGKPQPMTQEKALSNAMFLTFVIWLVPAFFTMLFSLIFVARREDRTKKKLNPNVF